MKQNKIYILTTLVGVISFMVVLNNIELFDGFWSTMCMVIFSLLIPIFSYSFRKNSTMGFLLTIFPTIIVVRNADQHDWSIIGWTTATIFIPLILQLFFLSRSVYREHGGALLALSLMRTFVGLNWLTHCTEKLFLSNHDEGLVNFFSNIVGPNTVGTNIPPHLAHYVIIFGGLIELSAAISLGLGLLSRFGALVASCYLVAAQLMSGHFSVGYTWALPGGGWELCFFFFMVMYPYMLPKTGGPISLDAVLRTELSANKWVKTLSGA
ncbi:DoxX family protein [Vibrio mediterranei]